MPYFMHTKFSFFCIYTAHILTLFLHVRLLLFTPHEFLFTSSSHHCLFTPGHVTRQCTENATWFMHPDVNNTQGWSNYTECYGKDVKSIKLPTLLKVQWHPLNSNRLISGDRETPLCRVSKRCTV